MREPKKLSIDQQYLPDLQSGQLLCKTYSPTSFWVVYGKVDEPSFMKTRIYEEDIYNNLYRDKKGLAYLLIPLLPVDNKQVEFVNRVYEQAFDLGLRENINLFAPAVYGLDLQNYSEVVEQFKDWYSEEELIEKFNTLFVTTISLFPYNQPRGIVWEDRSKRFKPVGVTSPTSLHQAKCSVLTCILRSLNSKIAAELMTKILGKPYLHFEFA